MTTWTLLLVLSWTYHDSAVPTTATFPGYATEAACTTIGAATVFEWNSQGRNGWYRCIEVNKGEIK